MTTLAFLGDWWVPILVVLFLAVSIILILTVLIQRPQGGGLVGAFGSGAGSGQTAFGAKTGDALTLATIGIFLLYLVVAVGLNWVVTPSEAPEAMPAAGAPAEVPVEDLPGTGAPTEGEAPAGEEGGDAEQPQDAGEPGAETADTQEDGAPAQDGNGGGDGG